MKNVTVSLDDETYRRGRLRAAEMDMTLSALVRGFINQLGSQESEFERLARLEREIREQIRGSGFSASDRLSRDDLYDRDVRREEWEDAQRA